MRRVLLTLIVALSLSLNAFSFVPRPVISFSRYTNLKMSSESPAAALDPKETALVLIEYQNEFTTEGTK